jgi:hypothetical protein
MTKQAENIAAASAAIAADRPIYAQPIDPRVYGDDAEAWEDLETRAVAFERADGRHNDDTIVWRTSIGRVLIARYYARCEVRNIDEKKRAKRSSITIRTIADMIGLTDEVAGRFGYKVSSLNACVDLGRATDEQIQQARDEMNANDEPINARDLRTKVNGIVNPGTKSSRATGADAVAAAKIALATGKVAGSVVTVGRKVDDDGNVIDKGRAVTVAADKLEAIKDKVAKSLVSDDTIAHASDDALAATVRAINLVIAARAAGLATQAVRPEPQPQPTPKRAPRKGKVAA